MDSLWGKEIIVDLVSSYDVNGISDLNPPHTEFNLNITLRDNVVFFLYCSRCH